MNRISALFLAFLSLSACARFRIEELQPSLLFSLNVKTPDQPNPEQFIQTEASGRVYFDLPARPVTDGTYLYVADPERSLVRVFSRNSSRPVKLYGGSAPAGLEDIKFVKIKAGIPGWIASDEDENIYVQIRSPDPTKPTDPELPPEERRGWMRSANRPSKAEAPGWRCRANLGGDVSACSVPFGLDGIFFFQSFSLLF